MKTFLTLIMAVAMSFTAFAQDIQTNIKENLKYSYAYISIEGKLFSKKLNVEVDFGDTEEQIKAGQEYSEKLTNKKSFAAVLNYMVENNFELVETLTKTSSYNGSGGTSGIVFIMRKKE
ncbi:MAG: hypothetical protein QM564_11495 [Bergeyella sp.]